MTRTEQHINSTSLGGIPVTGSHRDDEKSVFARSLTNQVCNVAVGETIAPNQNKRLSRLLPPPQAGEGWGEGSPSRGRLGWGLAAIIHIRAEAGTPYTHKHSNKHPD